jgi:DNA-binding FadR family transcriptional regulator
MPAHPRPEALRLHALVASAIGAGLADVAQAAMRSIVAEVRDEVARLAEREGEPPTPWDG